MEGEAMTVRISRYIPIVATAAAASLAACASGTTSSRSAVTTTAGAVATTTSVKPFFVRDGFVAPEAVRYDPDQDVYFVGNWGPGAASATDNTGYISRMKPDGQIETLKFIAGGTNHVVLHAPRGMYIVGDTLWVADADAVRGFNRRTGD